MYMFISSHSPLNLPCRPNLNPSSIAKTVYCSNSSPSSSSELTTPPDSLQTTIALATKAVSSAIQDGHKRILINAKMPGLNPALEQIFPYSASLLSTVAKSLISIPPELKACPSAALLFPSAGTSAAASAQYARDQNINDDDDNENENETQKLWTASYAGRDTSDERTSPHINILINPVTFRGDPIMDALESAIGENPDAIWLLLNPELGFDRAAVGMRESARRASFEASFANAFYFRPLFEIRRPKLNAVEMGSLLYCYGGKWDLFAFIDNEYVLGDQFDEMPTEDQISKTLKTCGWNAKREKNMGKNPPVGLDVELRKIFGL